MFGILTIIDYVGCIDCWKSSCTPTSTEVEQPWAWACNQSLQHVFYVITSHIELVSHNTYPLAIERNECIALIVLDMSCAFVHTWKFSFEQGVCIMLFGVKHILGWLVKEEVCQFNLLKVSAIDALLSPLLDPLEGPSTLNCGKLGLESRSWLPALKAVEGRAKSPRIRPRRGTSIISLESASKTNHKSVSSQEG